MSKTETIEQRVFRLGRVMHGRDTLSFADALNDRNFKLACKLVELAIAEEREACALIADDYYTVSSVSKVIRARCAAPKDEVSE